MTRRDLVKSAAAAGFPAIVPSAVFGKAAPSNTIQVAQLGCGRIARGSEFPGVFRHSDIARFVAVSDLDTVRIADAKKLIESTYERKHGAASYAAVKAYPDYREMLGDKSIDAVCISTPDHWHAQPAIEAALAGKAVYLQKPASLTIREGRQMADAVAKTGRILQLGSQQRSDFQFRFACELVRNGRIGKVQEIFIGLPTDPSGEVEKQQPVPRNLNYEAWLGSTPDVFYTEKRVHPQSEDPRVRYDRPGWLRCEQFGAGMITGWGAHHVDSAHWGMGTEYTGPIEISGSAEFPTRGLWNVHGPFKTEALYADGVRMIISGEFPNGIKFEGTEGWVFVSRGNDTVTSSDPVAKLKDAQALSASDPKIITSVIGPDEIHLYESRDHHGNWLECVRSRQQPIAPAEVAHRSCSACLLHHAAMKTKRQLYWDPIKERFKNDDEANALLSRPQRWPYAISS